MRLLDRSSRLPAARQARLRAGDGSRASRRSSTGRTASSSSPAPPAPARPPRSTPRSTRSTGRTCKIITVEDPVEYQLKGINQIQVQAEDRADLRQRACATSCARTRTSSWSARSATWRRRRSPSRPRSPATWSSPRCTPTTRRARSPGSRHGRRAVPGRLGAERRARPAAGAAHLRRRAGRPTRRSPADLLALGVTDVGRRRALPRQGLRRLPRHRLPGPHRHLRAVPDQRGGAQPHPAQGARRARSAGTR